MKKITEKAIELMRGSGSGYGSDDGSGHGAGNYDGVATRGYGFGEEDLITLQLQEDERIREEDNRIFMEWDEEK